jgi:hypothetical protein
VSIGAVTEKVADLGEEHDVLGGRIRGRLVFAPVRAISMLSGLTTRKNTIAAMITATARATTFPRRMKSRNSLIMARSIVEQAFLSAGGRNDAD